jgi:hypothetical protein
MKIDTAVVLPGGQPLLILDLKFASRENQGKLRSEKREKKNCKWQKSF